MATLKDIRDFNDLFHERVTNLPGDATIEEIGAALRMKHRFIETVPDYLDDLLDVADAAADLIHSCMSNATEINCEVLLSQLYEKVSRLQ